MLLERARKALEDLAESAPSARTRADLGDAGQLATLAGRVLGSSEDELRAPGVLRDLAAQDRAVATSLRRLFEAPFDREARLRARMFARDLVVAGTRMNMAEAMRTFRGSSPDRQAAARVAIESSLDDADPSEDLAALVAAFGDELRVVQAVRPPPPPARPGALIMPSAEIVASLALGTFDPAMLSPPAQTDDAAPSDATKPASALSPELREVARALADAVVGRPPEDFTAWRAARAGRDVADFRPASELVWLPESRAVLPYEQPGVPLARRGACCALDLDASSVIAHLLASGDGGERYAFGAALAISSCTRVFVRRALREPPPDVVRAQRTFALELAARGLEASIAAIANGDAQMFRDLSRDVFGDAPPPMLARWWAAETALAGAPGEENALYARDRVFENALFRGVTLAERLREGYDEDWFRNPSLDLDSALELARSTSPGSAVTFARWLRAETRV